MQLDIDRILRESFVARAEYHASIGSTNDLAKQLAVERSVELPLLVAADHQSSGRGRDAKRWWTGRGSLAFSLVVDGRDVGADRGPAPLVALATAVAVVDVVAPLLPSRRVGIHWPNDVMASDRKLTGILIEALPNRRHVIGIGLNTNNSVADAPVELQAIIATLRDLTEKVQDQTQILIDLLRRLEHWFCRLAGEPTAVAARANELCLQWGQTLTLRRANGEITGRCLGIASDGAIRLETPTGITAIYSGTTNAAEA
jgi:BirA family transcriptional regulator, biotin operon repressor / biotin---[acetyl-CoA-carboxylase] ligase